MVEENSARVDLEPSVLNAAQEGTTINTDEWGACPHLPLEGLWTGLRNFLRPFRGVNKIYLQHYVARRT